MSDNKQITEESILLRSVENYFKSAIPICDFQAFIPSDALIYIGLLVKEPGESQFKKSDQLNSLVIRNLILNITSYISPLHEYTDYIFKSDALALPNINNLDIEQRIFEQRLYLSIEDTIKSNGFQFTCYIGNPKCYATIEVQDESQFSDPKFRAELKKRIHELKHTLSDVFEISMNAFDQFINGLCFIPIIYLKMFHKDPPIAPEAPWPTFLTSNSAQNLGNNNSNDGRNDRGDRGDSKARAELDDRGDSKARAEEDNRNDSKAQTESENTPSQSEAAKPIPIPRLESPKKLSI